MVARNKHMQKLKGSYLFREIDERKAALLRENPGVELVSLGTGDTSEPVPKTVVDAMVGAVKEMGTIEGYRGYGPDFGLPALRRAIARDHYGNLVSPEEVFVSDGAGCDIARLSLMLGNEATLAAQDPSYPAYVDCGVISGQTGSYNEREHHYCGVAYLPCRPENDFFPDLDRAPRTDLIAFCSPHNPTGTAATRKQMQALVDFARHHRSIILYDAVYTPFISNSDIPFSIYEIPGARDVAIECHSFSKSVGFTGIRLGWTVIPQELRYEDGSSVAADWIRLTTTTFNGASLISQAGGLAALTLDGRRESNRLVGHYRTNACLLKQSLLKDGHTVYGGEHAPYLWLHLPGMNSWDAFEEILRQAHVVTLPGSGFGPAGEGFLRLSTFGHREKIQKAAERLAVWSQKRKLAVAAD